MKREKKVLWAIDPFEVEQFKAQEDAIRALDAIVDSGTLIQPVFVWGGRRLGAATRSSQVKQQADLILGRWPRPRLERRVRGLKVLVVPGTTSARAQALANYAKRGKFDLIVTSHHVRRGLKRTFIGSFSDSLSLVAETPLLIVPPGAKALSERPAILFPTDFSEASRTAYESALRLARMSGAKLTIFHKLETLVPYPFELGSAYSPEVMRALVGEAKHSLAAMKRRATEAGVEARVVFDQNPGHVGTAISAEAGAGYGLVALGAHKGFWDRLILGSTSRFVVRECPTAVWLIRPKRPTRAIERRQPRRAGLRAPANPENYLV